MGMKQAMERARAEPVKRVVLPLVLALVLSSVGSAWVVDDRSVEVARQAGRDRAMILEMDIPVEQAAETLGESVGFAVTVYREGLRGRRQTATEMIWLPIAALFIAIALFPEFGKKRSGVSSSTSA